MNITSHQPIGSGSDITSVYFGDQAATIDIQGPRFVRVIVPNTIGDAGNNEVDVEVMSSSFGRSNRTNAYKLNTRMLDMWNRTHVSSWKYLTSDT